MWRYRDYVVAAMNEDKPFNQFVREQIAGDLLPYETDAQRAEQLIATGFLMLGTKMLSERDKEKLTIDVVDEQIDTIGRAFMGLTPGCSRCHDHKFDPIPTQDYYALAGILRSTRTLEGESQQFVSTWPCRDLPAAPKHFQAVKAHAARKAELNADLASTKKQLDAAERELQELSDSSKAIIFDDVDADVAGSWKASTYSSRYVGEGYIHDQNTDKGEKTVEFALRVPEAGLFEMRLSYSHASNRASNVPITILRADGQTELTLDQTRPPPINNIYTSLGRFNLEASLPASLTISTTGTSGYVIVDAVQLIELNENGDAIVSKTAPAAASQSVRGCRVVRS